LLIRNLGYKEPWLLGTLVIRNLGYKEPWL